MAENEILDLGGDRWRRTRAAIADPAMSCDVIAECIAEELRRSLQSQLYKAFQQGQSLLTILRAARSDPAALRAAVESFSGQALARTTRDAIKCAPSREPAVIAKLAADHLIESCIDKVVGYSGRYDRFTTHVERKALRNAVCQRFEVCRGNIAAEIEASLCGQEVRRQRRAARPKVDVGALIGKSLVTRGLGVGHAPELR